MVSPLRMPLKNGVFGSVVLESMPVLLPEEKWHWMESEALQNTHSCSNFLTKMLPKNFQSYLGAARWNFCVRQHKRGHRN